MRYLQNLLFVAFIAMPTLTVLAQKHDTETIILEEPPVIEESPAKEDLIFTIVEQMPQFPGGEAKMLSFIKDNIVYPAETKSNGIEGTVYVSFIVDTDGSVIDSKIARGFDSLLNAEALRVMSLMPKWAPGKQNGKPVKVQYILPIRFILPD